MKLVRNTPWPRRCCNLLAIGCPSVLALQQCNTLTTHEPSVERLHTQFVACDTISDGVAQGSEEFARFCCDTSRTAKVKDCTLAVRCFADCRGHDLSNAHDSYRMSCPTTVRRDPTLLKGHRRRTVGTDGWQPKSTRNSIWQGKPAC